MENDSAIFSLPLQVWQQVLASSYNCLVALGIRSLKQYEQLFLPFCGLKSTSKHFQGQLDDEFFFRTIKKYCLKNIESAYARKRIRHLIKYNNYAQFEKVLDLGDLRNKYAFHRTTKEALVLIARHSDPSFMRSFLAFNTAYKFATREVVAAVRCANNRQDEFSTVIIIQLLPILVPTWNTTDALTKKRLLYELNCGNKFNFENVPGFDEVWTLEPHIDLLLECLKDNFLLEKLIVPEQGNLVNFTTLGSKSELKKGFTNYYLTKKKDGTTILIYRDRDATQHEISLVTNTNAPNGPYIYCYEDIATENLNELIVKTSLHQKIFRTYSRQLVAVTDEVLKLPLEEQPWFFGNISDTQIISAASEAPNTAIFFTYSRGGQIFLVWAETIASAKKRCYGNRTIPVNGKDISELFPKGKLVMGAFNKSQPKDLAVHFAYKYVLQGDLEKLKQHVRDNDLNVAKSFKTPNIVKKYLTYTEKSRMNDDLIVWLVEQGAQVEPMYYGKPVAKVIEKCQEKTILCLLKAAKDCSADALRCIFQKEISYNTLREVYAVYKHSKKPSIDVQRDPLLSDFLIAVATGKKFKTKTFTNRVLIMLAWTFGNDDNFFKMLPVELVYRIIEDVDDPPYFQLLEFIMQEFGLRAVRELSKWPIDSVSLFLPFFWKYWYTYFNDNVAHDLVSYISQQNILTPTMQNLRDWFKKISRSMTKPFVLEERYQDRLPRLAQYCLTTPTEEAVDMLKFLLQRGITKKVLVRTHYDGSPVFPGTWLAVSQGNELMVDYLLKEGLLPKFHVDSMTRKWKVTDVLPQNLKFTNMLRKLVYYIEN